MAELEPYIPLAALIAFYLLNSYFKLIEFDTIHLFAFGLAILGFQKEFFFGKDRSHSYSNPQSSPQLSSEELINRQQQQQNPSSSSIPLIEESTPNTQETPDITKHPLWPTNEKPTHELYGSTSEDMYSTFMELINPDQQGNWKELYNEAGLRISGNITNENQFKFEFELDNTPFTCFELLTNIDKRKSWDELVDEISLVEKIDSNTGVFYVKTKPVMIVSSRDSVVLSHKKAMEDGALVQVFRSVDHPKFPVTPKFVRATNGVSGVIFIPIPGNPRKTKVIQISESNPGGWVPAKVKNSVLTKVIPKSIAKINEIVSRSPPFGIPAPKNNPTLTSTSKSNNLNIELAPLLEKIKEVESQVIKAQRKNLALPLRLRNGMEWGSPYMITIIYFITIFYFFKKR